MANKDSTCLRRICKNVGECNAINVIPIIIIEGKLLIGIMYVLQVIARVIHTDNSDNIVYHIPFNGKH